MLVLYICPAGKEGKQMGVLMDPEAFVYLVQQALGEVQESLLAAATAFRDANIVDVTSYDELKAVVAEGE
jgi:prolyl-tRNA synthetase